MQFSNKKRVNVLVGLSVLATGLTLTSCERHDRLDWEMQPNQALTQQQKETINDQFAKAGVQVIQQGRVLQMVLPTDLFFEQQSTEMKEDAVQTLREVALYLHAYINQFNPKPVIRVSGYTDTVFTEKDRQKLSNQYAQVVAAYLWKDGFTSEQLVVAGYGALDPIGDNQTAQGSAYNRRVMIQVY